MDTIPRQTYRASKAFRQSRILRSTLFLSLTGSQVQHITQNRVCQAFLRGGYSSTEIRGVNTILQNKFEEKVRRKDETSDAKRTYPA